MGITAGNRIAALALAATIAIGAQALMPRTATAAPSTAARGHNPWLTGNTGGRGLRLEHGGAVADAVGKVFFTLGAVDYVCSGTLVRSAHVDVVLTAAHCVSDGRGRWATHWTFVPGYRDGAEPHGQYTARKFFVSPKWIGSDGASESYDIAFVQVTPGARVTARPAGLPVTFARSQTAAKLSRTYVFGYPALAPFSGLYANYCAGPARVERAGPRRGSTSTSCSMTAGDSGGPWLARFSPGRGGHQVGGHPTSGQPTSGQPTSGGAIAAVSTYKLAGSPRTLYGTVLGPAARALYRAATRDWHTIPT